VSPALRERLADVVTRGAVIALGNFDGVHAGHRALLAHAGDLARREGAPWLVVSFFPPAKVLFGGSSYLASREEKRLLLAELGPAEIVVIPFSRECAATPAEDFVAALTALAPTAIVVGEDFRFGRGRAGATEDLGRAAPRVEVLRLVSIGGEVVKSSAIREALEEGDLARANAMLGAPYLVVGEVVAGDRRGRSIGVPTANLAAAPGKALPHGVFAVTVDVPAAALAGADARRSAAPGGVALDRDHDGGGGNGGRRYGGMANVGPRPSFESEAPSLEAHLFGFAGDLYGHEVRVRLHARLRGQERFAGLDALKAQLARDAEAARVVLAQLPHGETLAARPAGARDLTERSG
jgi:riboflavin kinase / FMN adenylyltransferase